MIDQIQKFALTKTSKFWLIANGAGMVMYLSFASEIWPPPGNYPFSDAGEEISWALTILPIFISFSIANFFWLLKIIFSINAGALRREAFHWLFLILFWLAALLLIGYRIVIKYEQIGAYSTRH